MAARINGPALGAVFAGTVFAYAGLKGKNLPAAFQAIVTGKSPATAPAANQIAGTPPGSVVPSSTGFLGIGSGAAIAADALRYNGMRYIWGGKPLIDGGTDCSGLANLVVGHDEGLAIPFFKAGGYDGTQHGPPTMVWLAWGGCDTIGHDGNLAQPGDLAVWQTHMGICLGPNQMISAQNPTDGTRISGINGFINEVLFIRRLKAVEQSTATIATARPH